MLLKRCFTSRSVIYVLGNLLTSCWPLSASSKAEVFLLGTNQWSKKIEAICDAVILDRRIAQSISLYQSVMKMMNYFPGFFFGSSPRISIAPSSKGLRAGKIVRWCSFL